MSLFSSRKPRRFNLPISRSAERRQRLADIEERVRRELGDKSLQTYNPQHLRGMMGAQSGVGHKKHRRGLLARLPLIAQLLLLAALLLMGYWLLYI